MDFRASATARGGLLAGALARGHEEEGGVDAQGMGVLEEVAGVGFHGGIGDHEDGFSVPVAQAALQDELNGTGLHVAGLLYLILFAPPIIYGFPFH